MSIDDLVRSFRRERGISSSSVEAAFVASSGALGTALARVSIDLHPVIAEGIQFASQLIFLAEEHLLAAKYC